jgi:hypothetical protein
LGPAAVVDAAGGDEDSHARVVEVEMISLPEPMRGGCLEEFGDGDALAAD